MDLPAYSSRQRNLALPADSILIALGEHWIRFMQREGYGQLLTASGRTFPAFLNGLDNMHAHIALTFDGSKMPSFRCTELGPNRLQVDYYSDRQGLGPLVIGLLRGVGALFGNTVEVKSYQLRTAGADHDRFLVDYA